MNDPRTYMIVQRGLEWFAALGTAFWMVRLGRATLDGGVARLLRHRDRIWFALMVLGVPSLVSRLLFFCLFAWSPPHGLGDLVHGVAVGCHLLTGVLGGAAAGLAGCWFASSGRRTDRFSYGTTLAVTTVLMILLFVVSFAARMFRSQQIEVFTVFAEVVVVASYFVHRGVRGKNPELKPESEPAVTPANSGYNPVPGFLWLLVGLAPIPVFLVVVSSKSTNPGSAIFSFVFCVVCSLLGGLGCLRGVRNVAVRIVFGIFLGAIFFVVSCAVAIFQACSRGGGF